jgi:hypothetical protein
LIRRSRQKIARANIHRKIATANIVMITSTSERAPWAHALRKSHTVCSKHELRRVARVILPGAQALLGFQLTVTLTHAFEQVAAPVPLAIGIAADLYVATSKATECAFLGVIVAIFIFAILAVLWYGLPLYLRRNQAIERSS